MSGSTSLTRAGRCHTASETVDLALSIVSQPVLFNAIRDDLRPVRTERRTREASIYSEACVSALRILRRAIFRCREWPARMASALTTHILFMGTKRFVCP